MCKNSGFRSRIQKSYKKFGIESKNLIIFSESIPNLYPLCLPLPHTDRTDLTGFLCGWEISRRLSAPLLPKAHTDSARFNKMIICGNSWLKNLCKNCVNSEICGFICGLKASHKFSRIICGLNGLFLNNFTYLCLYVFQKTFRVMTTSNPHRHIKKRLMKTVGAHAVLLWLHAGWQDTIFSNKPVIITKWKK